MERTDHSEAREETAYKVDTGYVGALTTLGTSTITHREEDDGDKPERLAP
jgi:hypothetical protein